MRIAKVENMQDAEQFLRPYYKLRGVFYEPLDKQIKDVFVGISDWGVSAFHYISRYGEGHEHTFTKADMGNLFLYAAFTDNSIRLISDLYDDSELVNFIKDGKTQIELNIKTDNNWSEAVKVQRGLSAIILVNQPEGKLEVQYKDVPDGIEQSIIINELGFKERINMHYYERFKDMKNPHIRFRASDTAGPDMDIFISLVDNM
ncbi:MAG TPA: hypothetical protein DDY18_00255 [Flavobacterium sp.]|nr:hypothetical protein [Flavobacterium sp.]